MFTTLRKLYDKIKTVITIREKRKETEKRNRKERKY